MIKAGIQTTELNYLALWLATKLSPGSSRFDAILKRYSSNEIQNSFREIPDLTPNEIDKMSMEGFYSFENRIAPILKDSNIDVIFKSDSEYPDSLRKINNPPNALFVRGKLPEKLQCLVGIVGSRKCSEYGLSMTKTLTERIFFNKSNACIVSGMAKGIDEAAKDAALLISKEMGFDFLCPTVAVLASGVDIPDKKKSIDKYTLLTERGCVISEFEPGYIARKFSYHIRNRIIAALSEILIVVEASENSGSLITANLAQKFGKKIFAVPGRVGDSCALGVNTLIAENKAIPIIDPLMNIFTVNNIEKNFLPKNCLHNSEKSDNLICGSLCINENDEKTSCVSDAEMQILNALKEVPLSFDELYELTDISVSQLNLFLTKLQLDGIISQLPCRTYCINNR